MEETDKPKEPTESDSLENLEEESTSEVKQTETNVPPPVKKQGNFLKNLVNRLNVYLLLFIVVVLAGAIVFFVVFQASQEGDDPTITTQELTQETIDQLLGSDSKVGDPKQLLTIESNAVFTGKVLVQDGLDVAGPITVGGALSLPGITVSGNSAFDEVTINNLTTTGNALVQGQVSIQQGLTVSGPVTFAGTFSAASFSIQNLQVDQELLINRHIDAGGPTPGVSAGGAVGGGGTVTISGTDTAGTVTVNVGGGAGAGNLATVNFAAQFNATPHVVITPVTSQASMVHGAHKFYLSGRTSGSFTIATSGGLPAGSVSFDYIVID